MLDALFTAGLMLLVLLAWQTLMWSASRWYIRRQTRRTQADIERYSRWICPQCRQPYGTQLLYVKCGDKTPFVAGGAIRHVVLACPSCRFLNPFDREGNALYPPGFLPSSVTDENGMCLPEPE